MFKRVNSDVVPFSINSPAGNRYAFGTTDVSNDIDVNYNENIKKGFGTGPNEFPELEDFNALMFTGSYLAAYLYQAGIPGWNDKQKYYINSIAMGSDGNLYKSLTGTEETPNVDNNPTLAGSVSWKSILSEAVKLTGNQTVAGVKTFSSSPIVPTPTADNAAVNKIYVDEATNRIGLIDYGYVAKNYHIVAFGGVFNRADYPKLWTYLQANPSLVKTDAEWQTEVTANGGICGFYSKGNGSTTFRAPSLIGAFLRPDSRSIASFQRDVFESHSHECAKQKTGVSGDTGGNYLLPLGSSVGTVSYTSSVGGTETRPKNIAVLPLIVAK